MQTMYKKWVGASALVLFFFSTQGFGLQPLSEFLGAVKTNSFDAREANVVVEQRNNEWKAAIGRLLPSLSISGNFIRNSYEDRSITVGLDDQGLPISAQILAQNQLSGVFNVNVPLIDVAGIQRARAANATKEAASLRSDAAVLEIKKNVAKIYFQYVASAALVVATEKSLSTAEENQNISERKLLAGTVSSLDVERARADTERARQTKSDAELTQILAGRSLETLTGISPEGEVAPLEVDLSPEAPLSKWQEKIGEVPSIKASQEDARAAELTKHASFWALAPTLSATFNDQLTNQSGFALQNNTWYLGLSLAWRFDLSTVFNAKSFSSAASLATIREERARRDVQDQVFNVWSQVKAYLIRSQAARAQVKASAKAQELAEVRYQAGIATQLEVSQAARDHLNAEANRIQTDADLAYGRALLRITTSQPL